VEYEIYTFGEQIVVMPLAVTSDGWWVTSKKNMVSEYAKQSINQKLQKILPCDFMLRVKGTSVDLYIPDEFKWRIIGKWWSAINDLEKTVGLRINIKSFGDLPLLDVQTKLNDWGKSGRADIIFPQGYENKEIVVLAGEDMLRSRTDNQGILVLKNKSMVKDIQKKWYLLVDVEKL
jgi:predicted PilT family ATPase